MVTGLLEIRDQNRGVRKPGRPACVEVSIKYPEGTQFRKLISSGRVRQIIDGAAWEQCYEIKSKRKLRSSNSRRPRRI